MDATAGAIPVKMMELYQLHLMQKQYMVLKRVFGKKIPGAQITCTDPPSWQTTLFCSYWWWQYFNVAVVLFYSLGNFLCHFTDYLLE